jgi:hypothetical protein
VILLGVVAGASIAGVLGILLAAPTLATVCLILRYIYCKLVDTTPFPEDNPVLERVDTAVTPTEVTAAATSTPSENINEQQDDLKGNQSVTLEKS